MSQPLPLLDSLQHAFAHRARQGMTMFSLDKPLPSGAPDFFTNDYLSLSTGQELRDNYLGRVQGVSRNRLFGSTGSRLGTGGSVELDALEKSLGHFFGAPSALLFNSGFNANLAFLGTVPRTDDVIIYDELIHVSCREGIRASPSANYRFAHNSLTSFKECLLGVLQKHPQITRGNSTVFVVLESLYSMNGDFCPLREIVELVEAFVPADNAHIIVDEAHTSGICGPNGTGYVSHLGLDDRVHTKIHTFGKAWGFHRAIMLTSPIIRIYLINFAKNVMFSTSMPYTDIYALESSLAIISSPRGEELRESLSRICRYAHEKLSISLKNVPETILELDKPDDTVTGSDHGLYSQIIPVYTPLAARLADYLQQKCHPVTPLTYPMVKRPRIRIIIHARNTKEEIDSFVNELVAWAKRQEDVSPQMGSTGESAEAGESYAKVIARL